MHTFPMKCRLSPPFFLQWLNCGIRAGVFIVLICVWGMPVPAATLIITRDGKSVWADRVEAAADSITFVSQADGARNTLSRADVAVLCSKAEPGREYSPQAVKDTIAELRDAQRRFPRLAKQITMLLDEWEALAAGAEPLKAELKQLCARKAAAAEDIRVYREVESGLQMLRYKDMQGTLWKQVDGELAALKDAFVKANLPTARELADAPETTIEGFRKLDRSVADLASVQPSEEVIAELARRLAERREATIRTSLERARSTFGRTPSIDTYLHVRGILTDLRDDVANTDGGKKTLDGQIAKLVTAISGRNPTFHFQHKGFPLSPDDLLLLQTLKPYCSSMSVASIRVRERCFMFPTQKPSPGAPGSRLRVPMRLVFNQAWKGDAVFAVVLSDGDTFVETLLDVPAFALKQGHVDLNLEGVLPTVPDGFDGNARRRGIFVWLAERDPAAGQTAGEPGDTWIGLSMGCRLPLK